MDIPRSEWTVSSSCLNAVAQAAKTLGCDADDLMAKCGLSPMLADDADAQHPFDRFYEFYIRCEEKSGSADIGLIAGRIDHSNRLNLQIYVQSLCRNFREYLNFMPSALRFAGHIGEARVERVDDLIRLVWQPLWDRTTEHRFLSDQILCYASRIHDSTSPLPIRPVRAEFTYATPTDTAMLDATYGCELRFGQSESCIVYHADCLEFPMIPIYAGWDRAFEGSVRHLFSSRAESDGFLDKLQAAVVRHLPTGELHIDRVAADLHVSRRTLQRRLRERGDNFQNYVTELRLEMADAYLRDKQLGISDIAFLLGYSGHASFTSAFRAKRGVPPSEYRAQFQIGSLD